MPTPDTLPARLRALREAAGLSRYALARAAGIHPGTYGRYEAGRKMITLETAGRIAAALGVSLAVFDGLDWGAK